MVVVASTTAALAQWHTYVHLSLCVWILYSTFMGHWPLPKTRINWMQAASSLNLKYLVKGVSPGKKKHTHNWMELEVNVILTTTKYAQRIDSLQDLYEKYLVMILCCTIVCYEPETLKASHNKENLHFFHKQKHVTPVILKKKLLSWYIIGFLCCILNIFLSIKRYVYYFLMVFEFILVC